MEGRGEPQWHIAPTTALIAALLCWSGFVVVAVWVSGGGSSPFDEAGVAIFRSSDSLRLVGPEWMAEGVRDLTALGGVFLRNLFAIIAVIGLLTLGFRHQATALLITVAGGWALNVALKGFFMRDRPGFLPHLMEAGGYSFPSGHSFNAAVVYISMALIFAGFSQRLAVRAMVIAVAIILCVAVGISRVALGVHFPTDVVAGLAGGAGWVFLCMALFGPHFDFPFLAARKKG